ncbi:MAG: hypothetical protein KME18_07230 [Phormidium tanganyikae FI6-MK23]|nr:hypothetical protein [Phormidium tanganyikae FI6-MK23]
MFKFISCLVASAIVLAPMLPAHAGYHRIRSSGFGVSIGSPSFGFSIGTPYGGNYRPYRNRVVPRRSFYDPYRRVYPNVYSPRVYSPGFRNPTVIVVPRTVIVNPGYNRSSYCGSVIYGSPISSPIPVDPFTGLACR